ncbi:MAG TPA: radical SAM protein [Candidatus Binataceae bacterium]|nr:radical SAM protein [Candidatus Binataceae bacterium]
MDLSISSGSMRRYLRHSATRALTPTGGFLGGFAFSLNPYVGCAFGEHGGCPYCYVRALPVAHSLEGGWGAWVIAKANLPELLSRELAALERAGKLADTTVFMSSATDPYQGLERSQRLTQGALAAFIRKPPRRILLQTRSPLIERDIALLQALGDAIIASITVETDDESVRRAFTPTSPSVARRLACARRLREAGIFTQLAIAPMLPNNPVRFAELAADAADRVIVDTYFDGDGAGGRRSRALGMAEVHQRLGYGEWFAPGAETELLAAMRSRMGAERVLFSRAGFNAV